MDRKEVKEKLQFQKVVMSILFVAFIIFLILAFVTGELWVITGSMVSIFLLIDYLFILTVFNGNASKKMKK